MSWKESELCGSHCFLGDKETIGPQNILSGYKSIQHVWNEWNEPILSWMVVCHVPDKGEKKFGRRHTSRQSCFVPNYIKFSWKQPAWKGRKPISKLCCPSIESIQLQLIIFGTSQLWRFKDECSCFSLRKMGSVCVQLQFNSTFCGRFWPMVLDELSGWSLVQNHLPIVSPALLPWNEKWFGCQTTPTPPQ